ncbi:MAG: hypothetical protein AAFZ04_07115 [Pseudomonadota bacterium]
MGFTYGDTGNIKAGLFFDWEEGQSSALNPGIQVSYSHGMVIGSIEGVSSFDLLPFLNSSGELTLEGATAIFDAFFEGDSGAQGSMAVPMGVFRLVNSITDASLRKQALDSFLAELGFESCFGPGVTVAMWPTGLPLKPNANGPYNQSEISAKIWHKPIEQIEPGDLVVSFDAEGNLVPGPVTRIFENDAKILLDFHGTKVTPGHVYLRPDSSRAHNFETLIDVLRDDGVIQHQDGTLIRAATNVPVDDVRDGFVQAVTGTPNADGRVVPV